MLGGRRQLSQAVNAGGGERDRSSSWGGVYSIGRDFPVCVHGGFGRCTEAVSSENAPETEYSRHLSDVVLFVDVGYPWVELPTAFG